MELHIILGIAFFIFSILGYFGIRNEWVYRQRIKLAGTPSYDLLPSYSKMLHGYGFWRWDINYYLNKKK